MRSVGSGDVETAVSEMVGVLDPYVEMDWQRRAGSLEWSCWHTAVHVAHDLLAYAGQLAARARDSYLPFDLVVATHSAPVEVLGIVSGCGRLLSAAIAVAPPDTRAWHWGMCDPEGFAAMGVAEALVHTYDITQGLDVRKMSARSGINPSVGPRWAARMRSTLSRPSRGRRRGRRLR